MQARTHFSPITPKLKLVRSVPDQSTHTHTHTHTCAHTQTHDKILMEGKVMSEDRELTLFGEARVGGEEMWVTFSWTRSLKETVPFSR